MNIVQIGCNNVTTTDILESLPDSWLRKNTTWPHIRTDFIKFDETKKGYKDEYSTFLKEFNFVETLHESLIRFRDWIIKS